MTRNILAASTMNIWTGGSGDLNPVVLSGSPTDPNPPQNLWGTHRSCPSISRKMHHLDQKKTKLDPYSLGTPLWNRENLTFIQPTHSGTKMEAHQGTKIKTHSLPPRKNNVSNMEGKNWRLKMHVWEPRKFPKTMQIWTAEKLEYYCNARFT